MSTERDNMNDFIKRLALLIDLLTKMVLPGLMKIKNVNLFLRCTEL